ncbi:MAG TPA: HupE/UreJ family protein [Stenotrophobium sp.]|nr:HupE/UreJ family protein [Stenotrophobium sp.]
MNFPKLALLMVLTATALSPLTASAHKESDAYLSLHTDPENPNALRGQWDIALRDLNFVIDIDTNHDGKITWGEVKAQRTAIERYALDRVAIKGDGLTCALHSSGQMIDRHTDGTYDVILFDAICDKEIPSKLTVVYRLFQDVDPYHRGIVTIHAGSRIAEAVLGPKSPVTTLNLRKPDLWQQFKSFLNDGVWHIWTGPDHLLFIFSLLLPAVLLRRQSKSPLAAAQTFRSDWMPAPHLGGALIELIKVVSAFTVSHSVTLTLSVLGYVHLPSRLVESGIALSIIIAAGNNLFPLISGRAWLVAFTFGFIHGLGFASALAGLQLTAASMAASLSGFSIGVELGQEAIVLPFVPLAFLVRRTRFYQIGVVRWGSVLIIAIATLWLIQRAFDVVIPGTAFLTPP